MGDVLELAGITFAAVTVCKQAGLPARYAGLAAVVLGVVIAVIMTLATPVPDQPTAVGNGIVAGLSAAGAYSGAKAATERPQ